MSDPFIGEIRLVGFNYAPDGWALCQGQVMQTNQNQALYSLLGNTFGGSAPSTFGLPDLRGRSPVGAGAGTGLTPVTWGQKAGNESVTLSQQQLPTHTHSATFAGQSSPLSGNATTTVTGDVATSTAGAMVPPTAGATAYLSATTAKVGLNPVVFNGLYTGTAPDASKAMLGGLQASTTLGSMSVVPQGAVSVGQAGSSSAVGLRNPFLGLNFIIALTGLYPVRPS
jgi:microcystin-dependent protein